MKLKSAAHLSAAARCFYFVAPTGSVWCVHLHLLAEVCQVRTECSGAPRKKLRVYRVCVGHEERVKLRTERETFR